MPSDFLIARNPEDDSSLPYLLRVPLWDDGVVLEARDTWPRTGKVYCHRTVGWPSEPVLVEAVPVPPDFGKTIVTWKKYDLEAPSGHYVTGGVPQHAEQRTPRHRLVRLDLTLAVGGRRAGGRGWRLRESGRVRSKACC